MKRPVLHIFLAALLSCTLLSCHKEGEVIPRAKFSRIYADMLVADSWLKSTSPQVRMHADSTAFYAPIFRKYGFSTEDYLASVDYYLNDPGRFGRILRKASAILDSDIKALKAESEKEKKVMETAKGKLERLKVFSSDVPFYQEVLGNLMVTDRLNLVMDAGGVFFPTDIIDDTLFFGPKVILSKDSLFVLASEERAMDMKKPLVVLE